AVGGDDLGQGRSGAAARHGDLLPRFDGGAAAADGLRPGQPPAAHAAPPDGPPGRAHEGAGKRVCRARRPRRRPPAGAVTTALVHGLKVGVSEAMIRMTCPGCGREHEFSAALAGLTVVCKGCSTRLRVSSGPTAAGPQTDRPSPTPEPSPVPTSLPV